MLQKDVTVSLSNLIRAWEELAPNATFAEMTLAQFRTATAPAFDSRQKIQWLNQERAAAVAEKRRSEEVATEKYLLVVNSIKGAPSHGENSPLYRSLGYRTRAERRSGLTRKRVQPGAPSGI